MLVRGRTCRTIWTDPRDARSVMVLDQRRLPFEVVEHPLRTLEDAVDAIEAMIVRGAPLIGVTAAYGLYLALLGRSPGESIERVLREAGTALRRARPTAVNLAWAVDRVTREVLASQDTPDDAALDAARRIESEDVEHCRLIGEHGVEILSRLSAQKPVAAVNVLTHCNAGWLACVDWGTATSPIYAAHHRGIPLHVWIDETRPRNQGARLTAWELAEQGIPHTLIVDNAGGHLMQHGMVDVVIVGSDRTTATGDVCNKIGTYLKSLAARDNGIPFYAALPSSTIDWSIRDGVREIPIEERHGREVRMVEGDLDGMPAEIRIVPESTPVSNFGFDVTPARFVTGIITERGICEATEEGLLGLYPERRKPLGGGS